MCFYCNLGILLIFCMYICRILLIHLLGCHIEINACLVKKRALPHGTNAMLSRGTRRQTSQTSHISIAGDVAHVADFDIDAETSTLPTPHLCSLRVLWSRTGVCYPCIDVDCGTYICIPGPTFSSPAISSPAFSVLHFRSRIFRAPPSYIILREDRPIDYASNVCFRF